MTVHMAPAGVVLLCCRTASKDRCQASRCRCQQGFGLPRLALAHSLVAVNARKQLVIVFVYDNDNNSNSNNPENGNNNDNDKSDNGSYSNHHDHKNTVIFPHTHFNNI